MSSKLVDLSTERNKTYIPFNRESDDGETQVVLVVDPNYGVMDMHPRNDAMQVSKSPQVPLRPH